MRPYLYQPDGFVLEAGKLTHTITFTPDSGKIIGGIIFTNGAADGKLVNVELMTLGGKPIQNAVNIAAWKQRASANYIDSAMPLFQNATGGQYKLNITAEEALAADLVGVLVLIYDPSSTQGALTEQCAL